MACGTRTIYPCELKVFGSNFQSISHEEGQYIQQPKCEYNNEDKENSLKIVNSSSLF